MKSQNNFWILYFYLILIVACSAKEKQAKIAFEINKANYEQQLKNGSIDRNEYNELQLGNYELYLNQKQK